MDRAPPTLHHHISTQTMNIRTRTKKHLNLNHEQMHSRTTSLWLEGYNEAVRMDKHQKLFNCQELTRQQRL